MANTPTLSTRVSLETISLLESIERDFGPKPATITRLALEDYLPRYIAARGKPKTSELLTKITPLLEEYPELAGEIEKTVKTFKRSRRIAT